MLRSALLVLIAAMVWAADIPRESLVKIYTTQKIPYPYQPWSDPQEGQIVGSGCVIDGERILTNAHVVSDQVFVQVRRGDQAARARAKVVAVAHDADLAILTVESKDFFAGATPLPLGDLPEAQQEVMVMGYPLGGDMLSVTRGVVSRIEHQRYVHSGVPLLSAQVDAPINPGNSGGPVFQNGKVVGVVMQSMPGAQNIGYIVPANIIRHVLKDLEDGKYDGFPEIGVFVGILESPAARRHAGLTERETGLTVIHVHAASPAREQLAQGDVILGIDGHPVANDGTVEFRPGERTSFAYWIQQHQIGEHISILRLRQGIRSEVLIPLRNRHEDFHPVSTPVFDQKPAYVVFGGLVFTGLTRNYLETYGDQWTTQAPSGLLTLMEEELAKDLSAPPVILAHVLANDVTEGYQEMRSWPVASINGKSVKSMADVRPALEGDSDVVIVRDLIGDEIVIDRKAAQLVPQP
jgi:S1-C subfamily serine protease